MPRINSNPHECETKPGIAARVTGWFRGLWQDNRQAARMLLRSPAFSALAVLTRIMVAMFAGL